MSSYTEGLIFGSSNRDYLHPYFELPSCRGNPSLVPLAVLDTAAADSFDHCMEIALSINICCSMDEFWCVKSVIGLKIQNLSLKLRLCVCKSF